MVAANHDAVEVALTPGANHAEVGILRSVASLEREHVVAVALVPRPYQSPH